MRVHAYFDSKYDDMRQDLKHIIIPMPMKIKILQEIQHTIVMLKKVFQDDQKVDQRSLISSICNSLKLCSTMQFAFLVKFLKGFPEYEIDVDYLIKNFAYIKNLSVSECSKSERKKIIKRVIPDSS